MDKYALGKDVQLILSRLDSIENRMDRLSKDSGATTVKSEANIKQLVLSQSNLEQDYLSYNFASFDVGDRFRLNSGTLEFYPTGQWNYNSEAVNQHPYDKKYVKVTFTVADITWQVAWEDWVYRNSSKPIGVPSWNGQIKDHYAELNSHNVFLTCYTDTYHSG